MRRYIRQCFRFWYTTGRARLPAGGNRWLLAAGNSINQTTQWR